MELKKDPKADLTRKSGFFFSIALLITMSLVLFAFEFKQREVPIEEIVQRNTDVFDNIDVPITTITPPPPPAVVAPVIIPVSDEEEIEEEVKIDLHIDVSQETSLAPVIITAPEEPEAPTDVPFNIVEEPAAPVGGWSAFYKYLGEHIKYPAQATRMGTEGKVYVQFIVNRDGSIVDVEAIKGIGSGCDEEAVRVVKNAPKWSPGKQRGKPVRQKMVATVIFRINN
jgi:protein TonB